MNLHQRILTYNDCYLRGQTIRPRGIMVHSTGANNPNLSRYVAPNDGLLGQNPNNNHWNMSGVGACVHAFIGRLADGSIATYQTLPWNWRGWHCGSGRNGSANNTHISFEICEDGLQDASYFSAVYQEAVELTAYLCQEYGLDPLEDGVVICHSEGHTRGIASNHGDVMHWFPKFGKNMDTFRADVARKLKGDEDDMTQEQFDSMMDNYLARRNAKPADDWAKPYIQDAIDAGAMTDVGGTIERPQGFITRQEMAVVAAALSKK